MRFSPLLQHGCLLVVPIGSMAGRTDRFAHLPHKESAGAFTQPYRPSADPLSRSPHADPGSKAGLAGARSSVCSHRHSLACFSPSQRLLRQIGLVSSRT
ncbi:hypothetical protein F5883DRAFT_559341 [Diaporthe sp. PMI_573]|nr:hypothetical protein F5883DRAFT_559341 [Diaporthaceae sp. PMI_573]